MRKRWANNYYVHSSKKEFDFQVLRGWREIRDYCGMSCSIQTMRRIAKKYYMPVFSMNNRPTALKVHLSLWWVKVAASVLQKEEKPERI